MRLTRAAPALALAALGCGSPEPAPSPAPVVVAHQDGAEQAETAVAMAARGGAPVVVITFNDYALDPSFPGGPEYAFVDGGEGLTARRGLSLMGYSSSIDGGRSYGYGGKIRPPAGWAAIWGDPSIAVDPSAPTTLYLADLGISDASWKSGATGGDTLADPQRHPDGVCVARSTDGGTSFPDVACVARPAAALAECTPGLSLCVDHTAVGVDGTGRLYVAAEVFHHDGQTQARVQVWRSPSAASWSALAPVDPEPPAAMEIEPAIVTTATGDVWIAGATQGSPRDVAVNLQRSGAEGWSTNGYVLSAAGIGDYTGGLAERVHTAAGTSFRVGRTFALGAGAGKVELGVVYSARRAADASFYLGAVRCSASLGAEHPCAREPAWETAAWPGQQLMPTMSQGAAEPFRYHLAFLTDDRAPGREGTVQIAARRLWWSPVGGAWADQEIRLTPPDWPVCTRQSAADPASNYNGYWGDYLGTAQGLDATGAPFSVTAFSDSRPGPGCRRGTRFADPLHVAATRW